MFGRMGLVGRGRPLFFEKDRVHLQANLGSLGVFTKIVACWPFPGQMTSRKAPDFVWRLLVIPTSVHRCCMASVSPHSDPGR